MNSHDADLAQSLNELSIFLSRPRLEKALDPGYSAQMREQCARWLDRLRFPTLLHVLVKGNKRAGKSTLLNALLGADYLPSTTRTECTALPVSIYHTDAFRLEIVGKSVPLDILRAILPQDADVKDAADRLTIRRAGAPADPTWISMLIEQLGTTRANSRVLDLLQADHELHIWLQNVSVDENIVFIDTPGTDGNNHKREQASNRQYALASAFILVINWKQTPGPEFYRSVRSALGQRLERPILVVITNSDVAKKPEDKEGLNDVRREVLTTLEQNGFNNIYIAEVSARNARIGQCLKNNQITIEEIQNDEYPPLSRAETLSLGMDATRWLSALARSGNLSEIHTWLSTQLSKPRGFSWIAQEALNAARNIQYRLELHLNIETEKRTIEKNKLSNAILRANQRLSNELRMLTEKKDTTLLEFQNSIKSIRNKIGAKPKTAGEMVYYSKESANQIFSQIISFCQNDAELKKLKQKNTIDADTYVNNIANGYIKSEDTRIIEEYNLCIEKLRREIEQLAKEAWEKISSSAAAEKISPEGPQGSNAGKIIGGLVGGAVAIAGAIVFVPLIFVGALMFGLGWFYDSKMNPGDEYSANAIAKIEAFLRERRTSIDKQLEQAGEEIVASANKYFSEQINQIMEKQKLLDKKLNEPEATSQEIDQSKLDLGEIETLINRLIAITEQLKT